MEKVIDIHGHMYFALGFGENRISAWNSRRSLFLCVCLARSFPVSLYNMHTICISSKSDCRGLIQTRTQPCKHTFTTKEHSSSNEKVRDCRSVNLLLRFHTDTDRATEPEGKTRESTHKYDHGKCSCLHNQMPLSMRVKCII